MKIGKGESWELLQEGQLCKKGRKMCGRRKKVKSSGKSLIARERTKDRVRNKKK